MKKFLLYLFLVIPVITFSQKDVYTEEWYEKLDSDLECFIFPNPTNSTLNVRVYRGKSENHNLKLYNSISSEVMSIDFKRETSFDTTTLSPGIYYIEVSNEKRNTHQIIMVE